jgi:UDP-arabinose 4-epimerase
MSHLTFGVSQRPPGPTVLVAGGAGYIGSHTAKVLHTAGMRPVVLDNLCTGNRNSARFGPFYEGPISDCQLLNRIIEEHQPASAILLAAHAYVGESTTDPRKYFHNNVSDAIRFFDCIVDAGLRRIVFSSSCSVYGIQPTMPIKEDSATGPMSAYAETKLFCEKVLKYYGSAYGLRCVCLRYFNAAGADPEGELGEYHNPETHLIPLAIQAAMRQTALRIFGSDYPTPDGTAIRDYTHVVDLAEGHLLALRYLMQDGKSLTVNLGTGAGKSVREVIQAVEKHTGLQIPIEYLPRREGDAPVLVADPSLARELFDWIPRYSSLESIVATAWKWHQKCER